MLVCLYVNMFCILVSLMGCCGKLMRNLMGTIKTFEEIVAWQKARVLNKEIYLISISGPLSKDFGLRDQMRRSSVSVMSNIAEGFERRGNKEFARYLTIAKGSCAELISQLYVAMDVGFISDQEFKRLHEMAINTSRLIQGFKSYLKTKEINKSVSL